MLETLVVHWMTVQRRRILTILTLDLVAVALGFELSLLLRLDWQVPEAFRPAARFALPLLLACRLVTLLGGRLHRWSFRMSGLNEAVRLAGANFAGSLVFAVLFAELGPARLPRTVYFLEFFFSTTLLAAIRFGPRIFAALWSEPLRRGTAGIQRTIIVGAGSAGDLLARDLRRSRDHAYYVIGFVDDAPSKQGATLDGKPVLGTLDALPALIERHEVTTVFLAIVGLPADRIRRILDACAQSKAAFKIIPASFTFLDQKLSAAMLHDLSPEDLLPRPSIAFDGCEIRKLVEGKRALVTGGAGSIGGEICRQLAASGAARIVLVDMNENELYLRTRSLQEAYPGLELRAEVVDVREPSRLNRVAEHYRPDYVFHAAAHKHVPLMEDAPEEAIKNNVFGTLNAARAADACGASHFVLISTDKAVNPTSVMGASKRLAEYVVRDLAQASRTQMTAVRFGNVLGSAGSVVPLFKQQIERGGPVTVTHPECTRYFMTIPEAVGLVLLAGLGSYGDLCVLDMGEPIRIADLARNLITIAGKVPGREIPIVFTGLRPGEKLSEELLTEDEERTQTVRDRIRVACSPMPPHDLHAKLVELRQVAEAGDRRAIVSMLRALIPTYRHTTNGDTRSLVNGSSRPRLVELPRAGSDRKRVEA